MFYDMQSVPNKDQEKMCMAMTPPSQSQKHNDLQITSTEGTVSVRKAWLKETSHSAPQRRVVGAYVNVPHWEVRVFPS